MSNGTRADPDLSETLKHCSASTREAAVRFRQTGDPANLAAIIPGLIEHHVGLEQQARLEGSWDDIRLSEDLGIDSLTLIEIALQAEDVLQVSFGDRELRALQTLGDFGRLVVFKLGRQASPAGPGPAVPKVASWAAGDAGIAAMPEGSST